MYTTSMKYEAGPSPITTDGSPRALCELCASCWAACARGLPSRSHIRYFHSTPCWFTPTGFGSGNFSPSVHHSQHTPLRPSPLTNMFPSFKSLSIVTAFIAPLSSLDSTTTSNPPFSIRSKNAPTYAPSSVSRSCTSHAPSSSHETGPKVRPPGCVFDFRFIRRRVRVFSSMSRTVNRMSRYPSRSKSPERTNRGSTPRSPA
mmetsp:Transcript_24117/g.59477  ORF Transcript_24117/g.59477 Transcript_24117/m.59477 type:complete len:202 (-) Transcript_24117:87-692(-)